MIWLKTQEPIWCGVEDWLVAPLEGQEGAVQMGKNKGRVNPVNYINEVRMNIMVPNVSFDDT